MEHTWKDAHYCPDCGAEFDFVGTAEVEQVLKAGQTSHECSNCGARLEITLSVKNKTVEWSELIKLWECGIEIFPAIIVEVE